MAEIDKKLPKRQRIIEAAIKVFSENGFYNSTVADVASKADVADGTIYLYFKNKDDLLISIFEYSMDIFIQASEEKLKITEDPKEKLEKFIHLHLELVQKHQELAQVIQVELRQSSKFIKEYVNEKFFQYLGIVGNILEDGKSKGVFKNNLHSSVLKRALFGAIDEIALEWVLMKKKRYSMEEAARQLTIMILDGIANSSVS